MREASGRLCRSRDQVSGWERGRIAMRLYKGGCGGRRLGRVGFRLPGLSDSVSRKRGMVTARYVLRMTNVEPGYHARLIARLRGQSYGHGTQRQDDLDQGRVPARLPRYLRHPDRGRSGHRPRHQLHRRSRSPADRWLALRQGAPVPGARLRARPRPLPDAPGRAEGVRPVRADHVGRRPRRDNHPLAGDHR
jgi:hypothetical protein